MILTIIDNFVQIQLYAIHNKMCSKLQTSTRKVYTLDKIDCWLSVDVVNKLCFLV
jgi:hypothetical protein